MGVENSTKPAPPADKKSYYAVATSDVLDDERLTDKALRLYLHISRYANQEGYCWATNTTLAEKCSCTTRAIQLALNLLEKCGHIFRDEDGKGYRRIWIIQPPSSGSTSNEDSFAPHEDNFTGVRKNIHTPHEENFTQNNIREIIKENNPPVAPQSGGQGEKKTIDQRREEWFDWIFSIYPNKNARKPALTRWKRMKPSIDFARQVFRKVQAQVAAEQWSDGYWPEFRKWLMDERWNDTLPAPKTYLGSGRVIETMELPDL